MAPEETTLSELTTCHEGAPPAPPCTLVIFGATGDLARRKLLPALYNLAASCFLPQEFAVVGMSRLEMSTEEYRRQAAEHLREHAAGAVDEAVRDWLIGRLEYVAGDFSDPAAYQRLGEALARVEPGAEDGGRPRLYYLATPPSSFGEIVLRLGEAGLTREEGDRTRRVVVEKPFGYDLESARALNRDLHRVLDERQVYRIDHYLGKETVQNVLAFRFANGIFEPVWNRRYVDHLQITVAETVGVEERGAYYDHAGALRDVLQNHVFQLLAFVGMEPPNSFAADAVRDERVKLLRAIKPMSHEDVLRQAVRGQYDEGTLDGTRVPAYRAEPKVAPGSATETYAALKLQIENWRWAGVPFYLRTGKRLPRRVTEIVIQFKSAPFMLFRSTPVERLSANTLVLHIQPDEGVSLQFDAKVPGPVLSLGTVKMDFDYAEYFGSTPNTGYETLLYDAMEGDATLFHRADIVEASWSAVAPVLDLWKTLPPRDFPNYPAGSWGPQQADELLARDGRRWKS